ncbi:1051_t:CDS:10 [Entrophospora sp. SA101]|nr:1051_t:CDS:10 [Entrophospora sp. SA101]
MQYNDEFYQPPYSPAPSTFPAPTRTPPPVAGEPPNLVTAIFNAVIQNNVGLVSSILSEKRFNPDNLRNRDGKTPLMVAACENYNDGESALYQAAASGSTEVVEILIVAHANVELGNKETITPIMIAAYNGHADICRILLDYGRANINYQDKFRKTALMLACYAGRFEAAEVLLDRSADVNLLDQYGWTSLMIAAYAGHVEICHLLLHHNADKNIAAKDKTAVILARDVGHHSVANLIENYVPGTKPPVRSVRSRQIPNHDQYPNVGGRDTAHYARQIQSHRRRHQNQSIQLDEQNPYASKGIMMPLVHEQSRRTIQPKNANRRSKYYSLAGPGIDDPNPAPFTAPHLKQDMAPRKDNSSWVIFSLIATSCFCNPCLSTIGRMKDPNVRQAWREKVALCIIILIISGFMGFLTFGLATIACQKKEPLLPENILRDFGPDQPNAKAHIVRGRLYNTGVYFLSGSHRPIAPFTDDQLNDIIVKLFGRDISGFFPPNNLLIGCAYTPKDNGTICSQGLSDPRYHCHTSSKSLLTLKELDMNQFVGYSWDNVTDGDRQMFVYKENVYDITDYLNLTPDQQWLGDSSTTEWLRSLVHKDATKDVLRTQQNKNFAKCFDHFLVGEIDGTTIGCVATNVILIIMTVVFTAITLIKFTSAVAFSWFLSSQLGKISKKPKLENFSWGATRKISGEDTGHGEGGGNKFDRTGFPMKRWDEWMLETQKQTQFLPAYAPPNNASSYPTTTGMGMSPSRPTSPLPPQQPQVPARFTGYPQWRVDAIKYWDQERYDASLSFMIIATLISTLATITLFIFDIGKLWSIFGTLHIIGEVIVMLLLSQGGKISSYWFYGIVGGYIFLVNVINISLSWPYDAIWFKWQDFAILIVFTRIYLSTSEYVREQTSAQLPIIDDEDMNMENSSSRNEENSIAPKIINHPNQLLLLCFASFIHILGNIVHTFNPFDGRRYIVLNLSYAITFPCIALYIYLDTHCTSVLQSKRILLPDTPDWKVIVITIMSIIFATLIIRIPFLILI